MKPLLCKLGFHKLDKSAYIYATKKDPEEKHTTRIIFAANAAEKG